MFKQESLWIKNAIEKIKPTVQFNEVANIGSSTKFFREVMQPHIHENIIAPLTKNGWILFNVDMKAEDGVDLVADVTQSNFSDNFKNKFALTICTNLLEHVEDIDLVINNLIAITKSGGYILITVPYKYKIHLDPIDNGFRPTPFEILERFKGIDKKVIDENIIVITDIDQYKIKKSKIPLWGYRNLLTYYLGKRHKTSGILFQIQKKI